MGEWMVKLAMVDTAETSVYPIGVMTYTQAPALHEKNIFHLHHFTHPVETYLFTHLFV